MVLFEFGGDDLIFESAHSGVINFYDPGSKMENLKSGSYLTSLFQVSNDQKATIILVTSQQQTHQCYKWTIKGIPI